MRRVVDTSDLAWDEREFLESMLNVKRLPQFVILETVDEEE